MLYVLSWPLNMCLRKVPLCEHTFMAASLLFMPQLQLIMFYA